MADNEIMQTSGVLEEIGDIRTYDYESVCGAASGEVEYPVTFEIEAPKLQKCKNQHDVGACVAEVIAQISEAYFGPEMSEGHIYAAFRSDGTKSWGMYPENALKDWRTISTIPLTYFNHLEEMPDLKERLSKIPELSTLYTKYHITGYVAINYADKAKRDRCIKEALTGTANKYGLLAVSNDYFRESHCIWLTGWDDSRDSYIIKNSWGEYWGSFKDGRGYVPKHEINKVYLVTFEDMTLPFKDVAPSDWFYKNVKNAVFSGIMQGKSAELFDPNANLTRAEAAALVDRLCDMIDNKLSVISKIINMKTEI